QLEEGMLCQARSAAARSAHAADETETAADVLLQRTAGDADRQAKRGEGRPQRSLPLRIREKIQEVPRRGGVAPASSRQVAGAPAARLAALLKCGSMNALRWQTAIAHTGVLLWQVYSAATAWRSGPLLENLLHGIGAT